MSTDNIAGTGEKKPRRSRKATGETPVTEKKLTTEVGLAEVIKKEASELRDPVEDTARTYLSYVALAIKKRDVLDNQSYTQYISTASTNPTLKAHVELYKQTTSYAKQAHEFTNNPKVANNKQELLEMGRNQLNRLKTKTSPATLKALGLGGDDKQSTSEASKEFEKIEARATVELNRELFVPLKEAGILNKMILQATVQNPEMKGELEELQKENYKKIEEIKLIRKLYKTLAEQNATLNKSDSKTKELVEKLGKLILKANEHSNSNPEKKAEEITDILKRLSGKDENKVLQGMLGIDTLLTHWDSLFASNSEFLPVGVYGEKLAEVLNVLKSETSGVSAILGPTGSGKTSLAVKACEIAGLKYVIHAVSSNDYASSKELLEQIEVRNGNTYRVPTELSEMIINGGVIIFDEFTKLDPKQQGAFNYILDIANKAKKGELKTILVGDKEYPINPNFRVILTGNRNSDHGNYNVSELNDDIKGRIGVGIEAPYVQAYGITEQSKFNTSTVPTIKVSEDKVVEGLGEAGSDEKIAGFWKHEFAQVCLARITDETGQIKITGTKLNELTVFLQKLQMVHNKQPISLRKLDMILAEWKTGKTGLKESLVEFVSSSVKNNQDKETLINSINKTDGEFNELAGNKDVLTINFSILAEMLGVKDVPAMEKRDLEKEAEIAEMIAKIKEVLAEVMELWFKGYCKLTPLEVK